MSLCELCNRYRGSWDEDGKDDMFLCMTCRSDHRSPVKNVYHHDDGTATVVMKDGCMIGISYPDKEDE